MIRVPEVLGLFKDTPAAARSALTDLFIWRNSWQHRQGIEMPNALQSDYLFTALVRAGGTAEDFNWLVENNFCDRSDSDVWANALWERFDAREEQEREMA